MLRNVERQPKFEQKYLEVLVKEHIFGKVTGLKTEPKFRPSKVLGLIEPKYEQQVSRP